MPGLTILNEQDSTIVFTDLTNVGSEESITIMGAAVRVIFKYLPKSAMSMMDMTNMRFNKVVIGKSVIKQTGTNTVLFDELKEAKNWLIYESS